MRVPLPLSLWAVRHALSGEVLNGDIAAGFVPEGMRSSSEKDSMRPSGAKA